MPQRSSMPFLALEVRGASGSAAVERCILIRLEPRLGNLGEQPQGAL
jgi:hypothetical protein